MKLRISLLFLLLLNLNIEGMKQKLRINTEPTADEIADFENEIDPIVNDEENIYTMEKVFQLLHDEADRNKAFRDEIIRQRDNQVSSSDLKDMFMMKLMNSLVKDKEEGPSSLNRNDLPEVDLEKKSFEDLIVETMESWSFRGSWLMSKTVNGIVKYSPTIVKFIFWSTACYFIVDIISNFSHFSLTFLDKLNLILDKAVVFSGNLLEAGGSIAQATASMASSGADIARATAHVANIAGTGAQAISNSYVISYFLPGWIVTAGTGFAVSYFVPLIQAVCGN